MRGHTQPGYLLHLEFNVSIDDIVGEHPSYREELAILIERLKGLIKGVTYLGDMDLFLGRQIIEVFVHGFAWMDLMSDAIKASQHHSREGQIRITSGVRETHLDTAALGI